MEPIRMQDTYPSMQLSEWVQSCPLISPGQSCGEVVALFRQRTDLECVLVADECRRPVGLVMKNRFFRALASRFGNALFGDKPIVCLMDERPLTAELYTAPQDLIDLALSRNEETLYDAVVITIEGLIAGILTVGDLLGMSRLLHREASDRQLRTVRGTENMVGRIAAAVGKVREYAEQIQRQLGDMAEAAEAAVQAVEDSKKASEASVQRVKNAELTFERLWQMSSDNRDAAARLTAAAGEAGDTAEQIKRQLGKLISQLLSSI